MKLPLRFFLILILIHTGVGFLYFQVEALRLLKQDEKHQFESEKNRKILKSLSAWLVDWKNKEPIQTRELAQGWSGNSSIGFGYSENNQLEMWIRKPEKPDQVEVYPMELEELTTLIESLTGNSVDPQALSKKSATPSQYQSLLPVLPGQVPIILSPIEEMEWQSSMKSLGLANVKFLSLFLAFSSLILLFLVYFLLARPLERIIKALHSGKSEPLAPLLNKRGELGELSRLTDRFFQQQEELRREISLRSAAEASLRLRESQLERLLREREKLFRDLHDEIIQSLFALGLKIDSSFPHGCPERENYRKIVNELIQKLRSYLEQPSQPLGKQYPIRETVMALIQPMEDISTATVSLTLSREFEDSINGHQGREVSALITEALSNAIRHGNPNQIQVDMKKLSPESFRLTVCDDGSGCDLHKIEKGNGLNNMAARADALGGTLEFRTAPHCGFKLILEFPES